MSQGTNRREFLKVSTLAGVAAALDLGTASGRTATDGELQGQAYRGPEGFSAPPLDRVRMAFVGVGLQGGWHVRNFLQIDGVDIQALCDIDRDRAHEVQGWVAEAGKRLPSALRAR